MIVCEILLTGSRNRRDKIVIFGRIHIIEDMMGWLLFLSEMRGHETSDIRNAGLKEPEDLLIHSGCYASHSSREFDLPVHG